MVVLFRRRIQQRCSSILSCSIPHVAPTYIEDLDLAQLLARKKLTANRRPVLAPLMRRILSVNRSMGERIQPEAGKEPTQSLMWDTIQAT